MPQTASSRSIAPSLAPAIWSGAAAAAIALAAGAVHWIARPATIAARATSPSVEAASAARSAPPDRETREAGRPVRTAESPSIDAGPVIR